jgi:hypothetical protein
MQKEDSPLFNELCAAEMKLGAIVKKKIDDPKKDPPKIKNKNKKRKSPDGKRKNKKNKKKKSSESPSPASPSSEDSQEE